MKFSIITINYNNGAGLEKTMQSVLNQSARNFEYIVIDGGSTDKSLDIIKGHAEKLDYWISEPDKGIYHAMNKGTAAAHGEYLLFLNSGDVLNDNQVMEMVGKTDTSADLLMGSIRMGENIVNPAPISLRLFYVGSVLHPGTFIRKSLLERCGGYDENLRIVSDWKFFLQACIFEHCTTEVIPFVISDFDMTGISSTNKELDEKERQQTLQELIDPRIHGDYIRFLKGEHFQETPYDHFWAELRTSGFGRLFYRTALLFMKTLSYLRSDLKSFRKYPSNY